MALLYRSDNLLAAGLFVLKISAALLGMLVAIFGALILSLLFAERVPLSVAPDQVMIACLLSATAIVVLAHAWITRRIVRRTIERYRLPLSSRVNWLPIGNTLSVTAALLGMPPSRRDLQKPMED